MIESPHESCRALKDLLSPPNRPREIGWDNAFVETELQLNCRLPEAYKWFVRSYGTGILDEFIWVLSPFASTDALNLRKNLRSRSEWYLKLHEKHPREYPYQVFPKPEGLIPWAVTENGDVFWWKTVGDPESWGTVIYPARGPDCEEHSVNCAQLLYDLLTRSRKVHFFPEDFPSDAPTFRSVVDHNTSGA